MSANTLYDHVWDLHKVATLSNGQDQLFIGLHLIHEVTSPQAFAALRENGAHLAFPERTFATEDHIIPTESQSHPYSDPQAELMSTTLHENVRSSGVRFFSTDTARQGIVHVIGPELGLTRPGMTIACGDSHTSTHGAFGSLAFGIGTSEVHYVMETQTLPLSRLKVRQIAVDGALSRSVYAKDVILKIIQVLGVKGGIGYAYEYAGTVFENMSMEGRLTVCNMSIEGGARIGYVNPDKTTFAYIKGREFAPKDSEWDKAIAYWNSVRSKPNASYDDRISIAAGDIPPMVTWGIHPGQSVGIQERIPTLADVPDDERKTTEDAYTYMKFKPGQPIAGTPIDVVFIGSCTNSRLSDLREAAAVLKGNQVASGKKVIVVPGSQKVKAAAEAEGLDEIFKSAGAQWRNAGCSMCLAMNPDRLVGDQICASTSNRNFMGRQGSPTGRTLLMSPAMAAAAAITGHITDVRDML